jgi:tight adherence protein B
VSVVRRALAAAVLVAAGVVSAAPTAQADSVDGTLSGTAVSGSQLTTSLSLPASAAGAVIDATSVTVTVGGRQARVEQVQVPHVRRVVVLLVDTSGSMRSGGLAGAQQAGRVLADLLPRDVLLGLMSFSDQPRLLVAPTTQRSVVVSALDGLTASGETSLYDGVVAAARLTGVGGERRVLLLSDGGDTVSSATAREAMRAASGITVDCVAFRTDESQVGVLRSLAGAGHGHVVQATTARALTDAFAGTARQIASQVQVTAQVPSGQAGEQPVVVTAVAGATTVTARGAVRLGAGAAAPVEQEAQAQLTHVIAVPAWVREPWLLVSVAFALILLCALLLLAPRLESTSRRRTRQLDLYTLSGRGRQSVAGEQAAHTGTVVEVAQGLVERTGKEAASGLRLDRAGMALRPAEWLVLQAAAALGCGVVLAVLGGSVWWALPGLLLGIAVTETYVRVKVRRRLTAFERQLPDVLTLVASSLTTGFSLHQSLDAVAQDAADPVSTELYRALAETRIGAELVDALDRLADRMASENMKWTTMAIRIQQQVGGNLAETLRTTAATLREREQLRRMVRGLSAEGRLSAYILIALPIALFGYMVLTNRDYISLLWTNVLGIAMLAGALAGTVVGSIWMSRLVKVEV